MNTKVLVTGANGQLGKTIEELYSDNQNGLDFVFVSKAELDITKQKELSLFFNNNNFDYCVNCAAYTDVGQAEKTPEVAFKVNAEGVRNLSKMCKEKNTVLIHISTDYVFDGEKKEPYTIYDKPNPINEYGKSKFLGEQHIQKLLERYFIVRTSWLYSKRYGKNFYRTILRLAKIKKELSITSKQIGCPTNTERLARYIIGLIVNKSANYGTKHISGEKIVTWFEFAGQILIENQMREQIKLIKSNDYNTLAKRPKYSVLLNELN